MLPSHAIINLNKPEGITSQQAVTKVKRILGIKKAGHAGTLDPLATGVLVICLGEATKISRFLMDDDKEYRARMRLGERTETLDADGAVTETAPVPDLSFGDILDATRDFTGRIAQKPPMYSALKHKGTPLYDLARRGLSIERTPRIVDIHSITVTAVHLPYIDLTVSCSKGTYIRSLCDDLGIRLGTFAHLTSLARTRAGAFTIDQAIRLNELTVQSGNSRSSPYLRSIDDALKRFGEMRVREDDYHRAKNGVPISAEDLSESASHPYIRLKSPAGELFGIGRVEKTKIAIERILNI